MSDEIDKTTLRIRELIGTPWSEMHCGQLAYRVLSECLGLDVREEDLWIDPVSPRAQERLDRYLALQGDRWEKLASVREAEVGDVIVSKGSKECPTHLSIVIGVVPIHLAITTSRAQGCTLQRPSYIVSVQGVWRFVG